MVPSGIQEARLWCQNGLQPYPWRAEGKITAH